MQNNLISKNRKKKECALQIVKQLGIISPHNLTLRQWNWAIPGPLCVCVCWGPF